MLLYLAQFYFRKYQVLVRTFKQANYFAIIQIMPLINPSILPIISILNKSIHQRYLLFIHLLPIFIKFLLFLLLIYVFLLLFSSLSSFIPLLFFLHPHSSSFLYLFFFIPILLLFHLTLLFFLLLFKLLSVALMIDIDFEVK